MGLSRPGEACVGAARRKCRAISGFLFPRHRQSGRVYGHQWPGGDQLGHRFGQRDDGFISSRGDHRAGCLASGRVGCFPRDGCDGHYDADHQAQLFGTHNRGVARGDGRSVLHRSQWPSRSSVGGRMQRCAAEEHGIRARHQGQPARLSGVKPARAGCAGVVAAGG